MTRSIVREETFPTTQERLFSLLVTPSAICQWWGAANAIVMPETNGLWAATWGNDQDDPDYVTVATMREFEPPARIVFGDYRYRAKTGALPFDADFVTVFDVESHVDGARLRVSQHGFPVESAADEYFAGCEAGWLRTFEGVRKFLG